MKRWSSGQQLLQVLAAVGLALLGHGPGVAEVLVDLVVQVVPVGDDQERPVARHLAQHLLARRRPSRSSCRSPACARRRRAGPGSSLIFLQGGDGVVHAEVLMVLGDDLDQPALGVIEDGEVLDQIEEPALLAGAPDQRFQGDDALLAFAVDPLPLREMLPARRHAADLRLAAVRQDDDGVVPEQLRDGLLVVLAGCSCRRVRALPCALLEFDEDQRQAVDEADQIGPPLVDVCPKPRTARPGRSRCSRARSSR